MQQGIHPGQTTVYLDGALAKTVATAGLGSVEFGNPVTVGSDLTGTYQGSSAGGYAIDDLGIWRRALTAGDVTAIYTAAQGGQTFAPPPPLVVPLTIQLTGSAIVLSWPQGTLEYATAVTGPWNAVTGASPPSYSTSHSAQGTSYRVIRRLVERSLS